MQTKSVEKASEPISILYVETDASVQEEIRTICTSLSCTFEFATEMDDIVSRVQQKKYHIILLNAQTLHNPLALTKKVLQAKSDQEFVFIVEQENASLLYNALQLKINNFIFLPLKKTEIISIISEAANKLFVQERLQEQNKELEDLISKKTKELLYRNYHDSLTDLPNSVALEEQLKKEKNYTFVLLNIDHFADINNAYGFRIGDHVLREVVKLLLLVKPSDAKLFRLYSDEFVFLFSSDISKKVLCEHLNSLESFFNETEVNLDENIDIKISFSMGVALGRGIELLDHAKIALMELRQHKRGTYYFFEENSSFLQKQKGNMYWLHKIKESISSGNLLPYYQPIVNNSNCTIEKYECLVRIDDTNQLIPPIRFMEAAKITGMLPHITRAVIQQSFKAFAENNYEFSINITNEDFYTEYLEAFLLRKCEKYGIKPSRVVLEILEDITSLKETSTIEQLQALRKHGFKIAIDDFGSQSSNMSRLLEFSPDYLKIDGSFIKNIIDDPKSQIICEAIILISHKSNIKVIAEYVHSKEVQEVVKSMGIDYSQGYFFGKPDQNPN